MYVFVPVVQPNDVLVFQFLGDQRHPLPVAVLLYPQSVAILRFVVGAICLLLRVASTWLEEIELEPISAQFLKVFVLGPVF